MNDHPLNNQILGNFIGTSASGAPLRYPQGTPIQAVGVLINSSTGNSIGGLASSAGNSISGNNIGIEIVGIIIGQGGNSIAGDSITGNAFGIYIVDANSNAILGNNISFNSMNGLDIVGGLGTGNVASDNTISSNLSTGVFIR